MLTLGTIQGTKNGEVIELDNNQHIGVFGTTGIGKTTLLEHLASSEIAEKRTVVYAGIYNATTVEKFIRASTVKGSGKIGFYTVKRLAHSRETIFDRGSTTIAANFFQHCGNTGVGNGIYRDNDIASDGIVFANRILMESMRLIANMNKGDYPISIYLDEAHLFLNELWTGDMFKMLSEAGIYLRYALQVPNQLRFAAGSEKTAKEILLQTNAKVVFRLPDACSCAEYGAMTETAKSPDHPVYLMRQKRYHFTCMTNGSAVLGDASFGKAEAA